MYELPAKQRFLRYAVRVVLYPTPHSRAPVISYTGRSDSAGARHRPGAYGRSRYRILRAYLEPITVPRIAVTGLGMPV